jgi:hypothetical protein
LTPAINCLMVSTTSAINYRYTKKKRFASFPSPAGMLLLNSPWAGITELFLPRGSLVSDIPAGDGKLVNLFLRCGVLATNYCRSR